MSTSLAWSLPVKRKKFLPDGLKYALRKRYCLPRTFDSSDLKYLEGLEDADTEGAATLIELIHKHEEIILEEI